MRSVEKRKKSQKTKSRNPFNASNFLEEMDLKWEIVRDVYHSFYDSEYSKIYQESKQARRKSRDESRPNSQNSTSSQGSTSSKRRISILRKMSTVLSPLVETKTPSSMSPFTQPSSREVTSLEETAKGITSVDTQDLEVRNTHQIVPEKELSNNCNELEEPNAICSTSVDEEKNCKEPHQKTVHVPIPDHAWKVPTPPLSPVVEDAIDFEEEAVVSTKNKLTPIEKFRRAVKIIIIITQCIISNRERSKRTERKLLSWTQVHDDLTSHRTAYERYGLTFDPSVYKVNRETHLSNEVKTTLMSYPEMRSEEQKRLALLYLNTHIDVFGEYPVNMQKALVKVGWYEFFESKRIIIREGHFSENFYLILSGSAVVTVLDKDVKTGEVYSRTVALLQKGNSFGEIGLMRGSKRNGTVTCRDDMEVLAVGRQDFIDIFMHIEHDKEPNHIQYLRSIDELTGWPIDELPYDDPRICLFTYFRRGVLLCKDSNKSDWIYIIKAGSCRVLKSLKSTKPNIPSLSVQLNRYAATLDLNKSFPTSKSIDFHSLRSAGGHGLSRSSLNTKPVLPHIQVNKSDDLLKKTPQEIAEQSKKHVQELNQIIHHGFEESLSSGRSKDYSQPLDEDQNKVFVEIQKLGPNDTFGLEAVLFCNMRPTTSSSLVSEGTECILINKKFFISHLSEDVTKIMRKKIRPLPPDSVLQKNLQIKTNWEAYKTFTVADTLLHKQQVQHCLGR